MELPVYEKTCVSGYCQYVYVFHCKKREATHTTHITFLTHPAGVLIPGSSGRGGLAISGSEASSLYKPRNSQSQ